MKMDNSVLSAAHTQELLYSRRGLYATKPKWNVLEFFRSATHNAFDLLHLGCTVCKKFCKFQCAQVFVGL